MNKNNFINQRLLTSVDRRSKVSKMSLKIFPFNCIGQITIQLKNGAFVNGSGFLISSSLVLTAAHNLNGCSQQFDPDQFAGQFSIYNNVDGTAQQKSYSFRNYQICSKFRTEDGKNDYALMELSQKITRPKYFALCPNSQQIYPKLTVCGYQNDDIPSFHSNKPDSIVDQIMFYDIDTMPGQSGCPVYEDQDNTRVVAIHKGSISTNTKFNIGVVITKQLVENLQRMAIIMGAYFKVNSSTDKKESPPKPSPNTSPIKVETNKESQQKIKKLTDQLKKAAEENQGLLGKLKQQKVQNIQLQNKIDQLQKKEKQYETTIKQLQDQISRLSSKVNIPQISSSIPGSITNLIEQVKPIKIVNDDLKSLVEELNKTKNKSKVTSLTLHYTVFNEQ